MFLTQGERKKHTMVFSCEGNNSWQGHSESVCELFGVCYVYVRVNSNI